MLSPEDSFASAGDQRACLMAIRSGSRSFYAASWLLPAWARRRALALYAFCRLSDDAIDLGGGEEALAGLRARLAAVYDGRPQDHSADRAFADLVRACHIPRELPEALIEGFAWDCEGRRYRTLDDLCDYAARVAGAVGAMMTLLMGVRDPVALARGCELGLAMQLTNIARDVGEDARAGRLYLPIDWLAEAGIDADAFLVTPNPSPALARVVARLLAQADRLYESSRQGVARLPAACRPAILGAAAIYAEIGREVTRRDCDSVTARVRVRGRRKLALIAAATLRAPTLAPGRPAPAPHGSQFLLEAVARQRAPLPTPNVSLAARFVRVLEIFERLERAEQMGR
jgi:phytoene synthase